MIDEQRRHRLFVKLEEIIGSDEATTLMEHLPPVGWADVATKTDLALVRSDLERGFEVFRLGLESTLHAEITRLTRWTFGAVLTGIGVSVAASSAIAQLS